LHGTEVALGRITPLRAAVSRDHSSTHSRFRFWCSATWSSATRSRV